MGLPVAFGFEVMCSFKIFVSCSLAFVTVSFAACGNQSNSSALEVDAAFVAAEADRGNLDPLKDLGIACHAETVKLHRRDRQCATLEKAGSLRKPLDTRF